jgi:predicted amidohydrolase YtcJ
VAEANNLLAMGLTHVHDPALPSDFQALLKGAQPGTPLKLSWSMTRDEGVFSPPGASDEARFVPSAHAPKSVKFFLDGAHRTASSIPLSAGVRALLFAGAECMTSKSLAPFKVFFSQKITVKNGKLVLPYQRFPDTGELLRTASHFADRGYRLVIHALGNDAAVQAAEAVKSLSPSGGASIEHAMFLDDRHMDALAGSGAVVSMQPGMIPYYAEIIERMGVVGSLRTCALRSLADRGVDVCISSDSPCGADEPLFNMRRAVDRRKFDGTALDPEEGISREEALSAATIGGSLSMGNRNDGLAPGAPATFCVLDGDPFSDSTRVVQTWIDGVRAY